MTTYSSTRATMAAGAAKGSPLSSSRFRGFHLLGPMLIAAEPMRAWRGLAVWLTVRSSPHSVLQTLMQNLGLRRVGQMAGGSFTNHQKISAKGNRGQVNHGCRIFPTLTNHNDDKFPM